jgi:hypothetical protein
MDDDEKVRIELEDDPFADPAHAANDLSVNDINGRLNGAQDERAVEGKPLETATDDVPGERLEVDDDVGEFWQRLIFAAS